VAEPSASASDCGGAIDLSGWVAGAGCRVPVAGVGLLGCDCMERDGGLPAWGAAVQGSEPGRLCVPEQLPHAADGCVATVRTEH